TNNLGLKIECRDSNLFASNGDGFSVCIPSIEVARQLGFKFKYITSLEISQTEYSILEALQTLDNVQISQNKNDTVIRIGEIQLNTTNFNNYGLGDLASIKDILEVVEKA
ncbi:MAG: hypothetical protein ACRC6E_11580, partial [Fusobacteriaceae bacterium]